MNIETNKFGTSEVYEAVDLEYPAYLYGCACMSIQSEALSFANAYPSSIVTDPARAASIVVLSCQVTDLAVLNDLRNVARLRNEYPNAQIYVGGCLAKRFDIDLPEGVRRVEPLRKDYQDIKDSSLVAYSAPFWVKEFKQSDGELEDGHLFRNSYPLRIGVGCKQSCTYCTIRITRGEFYQLEMKRLIPEFLAHEDVVLICESPTVEQIRDWCDLARICKKPISIRNLEPQIYTQVSETLYSLACDMLLKVLHIPVQHTDTVALLKMRRHIVSTCHVFAEMQKFRNTGTITATNIITDYEDIPNPTKESLDMFDYVSWNPFWDGKWDAQKAVERFQKYLG
jgi:tRNA A37 methylthiotransferase MiaB